MTPINTNIAATLKRLCAIVEEMGYSCEVVDDELFIFTASTHTHRGEAITININVTANGENKNIGEGNYIAWEVFIPCHVESEEDERDIALYIMELIEEVDMIAIQYVSQSRQILISRVDCISEDLPDLFIVNHIIRPTINEFLHIFRLIENSQEPPQEIPTTKRYLN